MTNEELDAHTLRHDEQAGQRMLREVYDFLGRFVAYPSEHARVAHALWIVHAHMMDRWDITPRIAFLSAEPQSGKSRALDVTKLLVPRPMQTVNMSPAALFRCVQSEGGAPTLLFDEIDTVFGPKAKENEDIRGLLNAGYERGAKTYRCVLRGNGPPELEGIEAYCAVALAGIGWLPDTILSRSVIVRMRRRHQGEQVESFRRRLVSKDAGRIREAIETWAASQPSEIRWPELPDQIQDRAADIWEPLIWIADAIGGDWTARARSAGVALVTEATDMEVSLGIRLLADIQTVFGDTEQMSSKHILDKLCALEESPWGDIRGKPLDERGLARRLRQYDVKSKTIRLGLGTIKGYQRADFLDVWPRYIPKPPGKCVTSVTGDTDCNHCHKPGAAVMASVDGIDAPLHRECMDAWAAKRGGALAQSQVRG